MKRLACFAAIAMTLAPHLAHADAAEDTKDIRAGKVPVRAEWLGWDAGTAHIRTLLCNDDAAFVCNAEIVQQSDASTKRTPLLSLAPDASLTRAEANAFALRERNALAALPPLAVGATVTDPAHVFGAVRGEPTTVTFHMRPTGREPGDPSESLELVLQGKGGAIETLGVVETQVYRVLANRIDETHVAPDGKSVAFLVSDRHGVMCWDFNGLSTFVVDIARRKASLANTIGWRAYQKKDFAAARAGFEEATVTDPSYGLGWYNRAAMEARSGEADRAKASLAKAVAIDGSFTARAAKDHDFDSAR